jgi:small subunit ribosomal protein S8
MMTDPIADMLTRIRNAVRIERPQVEMPLSKVKRGLAEVLKREGYIWDWREESEDASPTKQLTIQLKYGPNGERVIRHMRRVSKPGRRVYKPATGLRPVLNGLGISIISTSRGVISDREARQRNLGGEVLCEVW